MLFVFADKSIVLMFVEALTLRIGKVVHLAMGNGFFAASHAQQLAVEGAQCLLLLAESCAIKPTMVGPCLQRLNAPIVKDSRLAIHAREALGVHTFLAQLLSRINHNGVGA